MAKSGLPFIRSGRLRSVARSSGFSGSPVEVEASKCKIDTILCNLKGPFINDAYKILGILDLDPLPPLVHISRSLSVLLIHKI